VHVCLIVWCILLSNNNINNDEANKKKSIKGRTETEISSAIWNRAKASDQFD